ncbi:MAG: hypothetical protein ACYDEE_17865, partial [Ignavibacteriaceae bacterium]
FGFTYKLMKGCSFLLLSTLLTQIFYFSIFTDLPFKHNYSIFPTCLAADRYSKGYVTGVICLNNNKIQLRLLFYGYVSIFVR